MRDANHRMAAAAECSIEDSKTLRPSIEAQADALIDAYRCGLSTAALRKMLDLLRAEIPPDVFVEQLERHPEYFPRGTRLWDRKAVVTVHRAIAALVEERLEHGV